MVPDLGKKQQRRKTDGSGPCLANTRWDSLGDCRWERKKGRAREDPLTEWVDGALTEVGSVAPNVGEEHSNCSKAEKKS